MRFSRFLHPETERGRRPLTIINPETNQAVQHVSESSKAPASGAATFRSSNDPMPSVMHSKSRQQQTLYQSPISPFQLQGPQGQQLPLQLPQAPPGPVPVNPPQHMQLQMGTIPRPPLTPPLQGPHQANASAVCAGMAHHMTHQNQLQLGVDTSPLSLPAAGSAGVPAGALTRDTGSIVGMRPSGAPPPPKGPCPARPLKPSRSSGLVPSQPSGKRKPEGRRLSIVDPATSTEIAVAEESKLSPAGSQAGSLGSPNSTTSPIQQPSRAAGKQQRLHIVNPETGEAVQLESQAPGAEAEKGGQQRRLRIIDPSTGAELGLTSDIKAARSRWLEAKHSSRLLLIVDPATGQEVGKGMLETSLSDSASSMQSMPSGASPLPSPKQLNPQAGSFKTQMSDPLLFNQQPSDPRRASSTSPPSAASLVQVATPQHRSSIKPGPSMPSRSWQQVDTAEAPIHGTKGSNAASASSLVAEVPFGADDNRQRTSDKSSVAGASMSHHVQGTTPGSSKASCGEAGAGPLHSPSPRPPIEDESMDLFRQEVLASMLPPESRPASAFRTPEMKQSSAPFEDDEELDIILDMPDDVLSINSPAASTPGFSPVPPQSHDADATLEQSRAAHGVGQDGSKLPPDTEMLSGAAGVASVDVSEQDPSTIKEVNGSPTMAAADTTGASAHHVAAQCNGAESCADVEMPMAASVPIAADGPRFEAPSADSASNLTENNHPSTGTGRSQGSDMAVPVPEVAEASFSEQAAAGMLAGDEPLATAAVFTNTAKDEPPSDVRVDAADPSSNQIPPGKATGYETASGTSGSPQQENCHSMAEIRDDAPVPRTLSDSEQHSQLDASHISQMEDLCSACLRGQDPLGRENLDRSPLASRAASVRSGSHSSKAFSLSDQAASPAGDSHANGGPRGSEGPAAADLEPRDRPAGTVGSPSQDAAEQRPIASQYSADGRSTPSPGMAHGIVIAPEQLIGGDGSEAKDRVSKPHHATAVTTSAKQPSVIAEALGYVTEVRGQSANIGSRAHEGQAGHDPAALEPHKIADARESQERATAMTPPAEDNEKHTSACNSNEVPPCVRGSLSRAYEDAAKSDAAAMEPDGLAEIEQLQRPSPVAQASAFNTVSSNTSSHSDQHERIATPDLSGNQTVENQTPAYAQKPSSLNEPKASSALSQIWVTPDMSSEVTERLGDVQPSAVVNSPAAASQSSEDATRLLHQSNVGVEALLPMANGNQIAVASSDLPGHEAPLAAVNKSSARPPISTGAVRVTPNPPAQPPATHEARLELPILSTIKLSGQAGLEAHHTPGDEEVGSKEDGHAGHDSAASASQEQQESHANAAGASRWEEKSAAQQVAVEKADEPSHAQAACALAIASKPDHVVPATNEAGPSRWQAAAQEVVIHEVEGESNACSASAAGAAAKTNNEAFSADEAGPQQDQQAAMHEVNHVSKVQASSASRASHDDMLQPDEHGSSRWESGAAAQEAAVHEAAESSITKAYAAAAAAAKGPAEEISNTMDAGPHAGQQEPEGPLQEAAMHKAVQSSLFRSASTASEVMAQHPASDGMPVTAQADPGRRNEEAAALDPLKHGADVWGTARLVSATITAASSDGSQAEALLTGQAAPSQWQQDAASQEPAVHEAGDLQDIESALAAAADAKAPAKGHAGKWDEEAAAQEAATHQPDVLSNANPTSAAAAAGSDVANGARAQAAPLQWDQVAASQEAAVHRGADNTHNSRAAAAAAASEQVEIQGPAIDHLERSNSYLASCQQDWSTISRHGRPTAPHVTVHLIASGPASSDSGSSSIHVSLEPAPTGAGSMGDEAKLVQLHLTEIHLKRHICKLTLQVGTSRLRYSRMALAATLNHIHYGLLGHMDAATLQLLRVLDLAWQQGRDEQQWAHGAPSGTQRAPAPAAHDEAQVLGPPRRAAWGQGAKAPRTSRMPDQHPKFINRLSILEPPGVSAPWQRGPEARNSFALGCTASSRLLPPLRPPPQTSLARRPMAAKPAGRPQPRHHGPQRVPFGPGPPAVSTREDEHSADPRLQPPAEAGGAPHTPTRPIAFGAGPPWMGSPEETCFPAGKLLELLDPDHPSFQPDVLKLWQVLTFAERSVMEMHDRQDEAVSPSGTVYFPHLRPVRLHLADLITGSPSLWQVWNSGSQPRSEMLQRLDEGPEHLTAILAMLQSAADGNPHQAGGEQMPAGMMTPTPRSPYHQPNSTASPASTAALWRVLTSRQRNQPEHDLLMESMESLSEPRRVLAKKLDPLSTLYQPGMAKVWANLDSETRDRLLEEVDESSEGVTLQTLQQAQPRNLALPAHPLASTAGNRNGHGDVQQHSRLPEQDAAGSQSRLKPRRSVSTRLNYSQAVQTDDESSRTGAAASRTETLGVRQDQFVPASNISRRPTIYLEGLSVSSPFAAAASAARFHASNERPTSSHVPEDKSSKRFGISQQASTSSHGWEDDAGGAGADLQPTAQVPQKQTLQMCPDDTAAPGSLKDVWGDETSPEQATPFLRPPPVELPPGLSWEAAAHGEMLTPDSPSPSAALTAGSDDFFDASEGLGGDGSTTGSVASTQKAQQEPSERHLNHADTRQLPDAAQSFAALEAQHSLAAESNGWSESEQGLPDDVPQGSQEVSHDADVDALVSDVQEELAQQALTAPGSMHPTDSTMSVPQKVVSASESESEEMSSAAPDKPSGSLDGPSDLAGEDDAGWHEDGSERGSTGDESAGESADESAGVSAKQLDQGPKPSVPAARVPRTPVYAKDEAPSVPVADETYQPVELQHLPNYRRASLFFIHAIKSSLALLCTRLLQYIAQPEEGEGGSAQHGRESEYALERQPGTSFLAEPSAAWELPGQAELHRPAAEAEGWDDDALGSETMADFAEALRRNAAPVAVTGTTGAAPKRWWETSKGKADIASSAQGGKRAADNTFQVAREADDFEKFGLLDDPDVEPSATGPARGEHSTAASRPSARGGRRGRRMAASPSPPAPGQSAGGSRALMPPAARVEPERVHKLNSTDRPPPPLAQEAATKPAMSFLQAARRPVKQEGTDATPVKPKRWWETDKGKMNIKHAAGPGRRAADNTYVIEREPDDFERLNLLDALPDRDGAPFEGRAKTSNNARPTKGRKGKPSRLQIPTQDHDNPYHNQAAPPHPQRKATIEHSHQPEPSVAYLQPHMDFDSPAPERSPEAAHPQLDDQDGWGEDDKYPHDLTHNANLNEPSKHAAALSPWQGKEDWGPASQALERAAKSSMDESEYDSSHDLAPDLNGIEEKGGSTIGTHRPLQGVAFVEEIVQAQAKQPGSLSPPPGLPSPGSAFAQLLPHGLMSSPDEQQQAQGFSAMQQNTTMPQPSQPAQSDVQPPKQGQHEHALPHQIPAQDMYDNLAAFHHSKPGPVGASIAAAPAAAQAQSQPSSWLQGFLQTLGVAPSQQPAMQQAHAAMPLPSYQNHMPPTNAYQPYPQGAAPMQPDAVYPNAAAYPSGYPDVQLAGHYQAAQIAAPTQSVISMAQQPVHPAYPPYQPAQPSAYPAVQYPEAQHLHAFLHMHQPPVETAHAGAQYQQFISNPQHVHAAWHNQAYGGGPQQGGAAEMALYTQTPTLSSHFRMQPVAAYGQSGAVVQGHPPAYPAHEQQMAYQGHAYASNVP
ncbi:hypothetical protein WJX74_005037 [Apatococcus lobatus]|uniref:Uncharacterized protein n=1 Tax=Apatococcus lobatus TaxID=904363 RepID=A0AAW1RVX4_9CHLO